LETGEIMMHLIDLMTNWGSFYANHAAVRTLVAFAHVGALIAGGGTAVTADRTLLGASRAHDPAHRRHIETLHITHRIVMAALAIIVISGVLLFASDFESFMYSRYFWIKMGLVGLLSVNGALLWRAERRVLQGETAAWRILRTTAFASVALWFLTTLAGVALPNVG
jgi:hypothetical protein